MGKIREMYEAMKSIDFSKENEEFKPGDIDTSYRFTCSICNTTYNTEIFDRCPTCGEPH